jgi:two-component system, NtrC family, response regulator HydG
LEILVTPDADMEETRVADTGELECLSLEELLRGSELIAGMVVRSAHIRKVFKTVSRLGPYKNTILIQGESGTGKELIARALHTFGPTPGGPFVTFNCSNLVDSLAESQLFGHVRGAFTDAREDSLGYFRSANGGTLFLDEIGELPLRLQPKLLRAVETREIQPVGSARTFTVDIRLVVATNRDLSAMVAGDQFRADLYYRLNATAINVQPLRERREAIDAVAGHLIQHYNRLFGTHVNYLTRRAREALLAYNWPGNVRELAHAIEGATMMCEGDRIDLDVLPEQIVTGALANAKAPNAKETPEKTPTATESGLGKALPEGSLALSLDEVIRRTLLRSLEETGGNRRRAADLLGVSRSTLYRMLSRYGLADQGKRLGAR